MGSFAALSMCRRTDLALGAALISLFAAGAGAQKADDNDAQSLAPITVPGEVPERGRHFVDPQSEPDAAADAAQLMRRVPGGGVITNGGVSGQAQYRGAFGARVNVLVDGLYINAGGPNWMDPPSHYAPSPQLESLEAIRGLAPVTVPGESLGGAVRLHTRRGGFASGQAGRWDGHLALDGATVNDALSGGGELAWANNHHRFHVSGSAERADDLDFAGGTVAASEYERFNYTAGYGLRLGGHEFGFEYRRTDTNDSGTPAFPLDILFFDTDIYRLSYAGTIGGLGLEGGLYYSRIDHGMSNFTLRPAPSFNPMAPGPDRRRVPASSRGFGWTLSTALAAGPGELSLGIDGHLASHDATVLDPDNPNFFALPFNNNERDRYSVFGQWQGPVNATTELELGLRYNHFETDAGEGAVAAGLPGPAQNITAAFNAADRDRSDDNLDAVAKVNRRLSDRSVLVGGLGRKTRSPSYIERYAYIPLEATAGLADGNNHVGDVGLAPEVAYEINLGFDWRSDSLSFTPRVFYRWVDDYITGIPVDATPDTIDSDVERVSNLNGDPTPLRFANVDAELYGFDAAWRWQIAAQWQADGVLSYVRGKRRDIDDNLYRIAPPSARAALNYRVANWRLRLEPVLVADQNRISATNNDALTADPRTAGYALLNISAGYRLGQGSRFTIGVDNLFDREYRDHLGGFNRVIGSDVGLGERLPGAGRNLFLQLQHSL